MVTFRHDAVGTPEAAWQAWKGLNTLPRLTFEFAGSTRLVVVAAHPDDETLGAGGLLALAAQLGARVDVVVASAGERSHPGSTTYAPGELALWRRREVEHAVSLLAPRTHVHHLDLPDGELSQSCEVIVEALRRLAAPGAWIAAPWRGDAHPDHEAVGVAAAQVATEVGGRLLEYPVWAWHWAGPGDARLPWSRMVRLDLSRACRRLKAAAAAAHRSQVEPLSSRPGDEALLTPQVLEHFDREFEVFVESDHRPGGGVSGAGQPLEGSLPPQYFDDFYEQAGEDPWGFTDRWYEERKRALTLACLPRPRFARAFEAGCSIGVLTAELAGRCDELLAVDVAASAVAAARRRTAGLQGVRVEQASVPAAWPDGELDLVVLSEVGYYCGAEDLVRLTDRAARSLAPDGVLLACHWRHAVADYPMRGDEVHEQLRAHPRLAVLATHVEEDFLLDVLVPAPAVSVARATGLAR